MKQAIYDRISNRTYDKKSLTLNEKEEIDQLIISLGEVSGPFKHKVRFFISHQVENLDDEAKRIGTYGFIKNAPSFIGGIVENTLKGIVDFGYIFESLILKLTEKEYGTCWLGGTFDRKAFQERLKENDVIPAITPVGHSFDSMSFRERITRFAVKANRRKPFEEMFFLNDIEHPLKEDSIHPLKEALTYVKLGPSASNKQPWRIIIHNNHVHFYLERTPHYAENLPFVIQALDLGIAILHFEEGLKSLNTSYQMKEIEYKVPEGYEYILSFELHNYK